MIRPVSIAGGLPGAYALGEPNAAQQLSDAGNPTVPWLRPAGAVVRAGPHRPQLQQPKRHSDQAAGPLRVKNRPAVLHPDQQGRYQMQPQRPEGERGQQQQLIEALGESYDLR